MNKNAKKVRTLDVPTQDTHQDSRKNQIHLTPGSLEYLEYVRDQKGIEEEDFIISGGVVDDKHDRRPDEMQVVKTEADHVANLAEDLRKTNVSSTKRGGKVGYHKCRQTLLKEGENPVLVATAVAAAAKTAEEVCSGNIRMAKYAPAKPKIRELVEDVGVMQDDYVPLAMRRLYDEFD